MDRSRRNRKGKVALSLARGVPSLFLRMVAVQTLLMNYFLLGLHNNNHISNDVLPPDDAPCSLGCSKCSDVNGCYACKPPFLLWLHRDGFWQTGVCKRNCPLGFYGLYRGKTGFCIKCELRGCQHCSSRHFCRKCLKGRVLFKGRCKKKCPPAYPYDIRKNSCRTPFLSEFSNSSRVTPPQPREERKMVLYKSSLKEERRKRKEMRKRRKLRRKKRRRLRNQRERKKSIRKKRRKGRKKKRRSRKMERRKYNHY